MFRLTRLATRPAALLTLCLALLLFESCSKVKDKMFTCAGFARDNVSGAGKCQDSCQSGVKPAIDGQMSLLSQQNGDTNPNLASEKASALQSYDQLFNECLGKSFNGKEASCGWFGCPSSVTDGVREANNALVESACACGSPEFPNGPSNHTGSNPEMAVKGLFEQLKAYAPSTHAPAATLAGEGNFQMPNTPDGKAATADGSLKAGSGAEANGAGRRVAGMIDIPMNPGAINGSEQSIGASPVNLGPTPGDMGMMGMGNGPNMAMMQAGQTRGQNGDTSPKYTQETGSGESNGSGGGSGDLSFFSSSGIPLGNGKEVGANGLVFGGRGRGGDIGARDPDDYFTRIGRNESLFQRATKRYNSKTISWMKDDINKGRAPMGEVLRVTPETRH